MIPRCPFCNAQGISQIEAKDLGPALLLFCKSCGAIHGVIPAPKKQEKKFEVKPLEDFEQPSKDTTDARPITPDQAALIIKHNMAKKAAYRGYLSVDHDREGE